MSSNQARDRETNGVPVERWAARPAGGDEAEDRLASLLRIAEPPGGLGTVGRARVWARLRQRPTSRARTARRRWRVGLGVLPDERRRPRRVLGPPMAAGKPPQDCARGGPGEAACCGWRATARGAASPATPIENAPSPVEAPLSETDRPVLRAQANIAPHASRTRGRIVTTPPAGPTAPVTPAAASALVGETPMLGEALTRLRQNHDPRGALATLDEYRVRYPNGKFRREAAGARIDALLLLGRNDEALAELRALSLQRVGRDQELRLIRGEVSASADCGRAGADFARVLAERAAEPFVERALHGRAACRLRLGDETGAIRDLSEYLRRFPEGRFAPEARRTIAGRREGL